MAELRRVAMSARQAGRDQLAAGVERVLVDLTGELLKCGHPYAVACARCGNRFVRSATARFCSERCRRARQGPRSRSPANPPSSLAEASAPTILCDEDFRNMSTVPRARKEAE
jgi:hypothetical protein